MEGEDDAEQQEAEILAAKMVSGDDLEGNFKLDRRSREKPLVYSSGKLVSEVKRDKFG